MEAPHHDSWGPEPTPSVKQSLVRVLCNGPSVADVVRGEKMSSTAERLHQSFQKCKANVHEIERETTLALECGATVQTHWVKYGTSVPEPEHPRTRREQVVSVGYARNRCVDARQHQPTPPHKRQRFFPALREVPTTHSHVRRMRSGMRVPVQGPLLAQDTRQTPRELQGRT